MKILKSTVIQAATIQMEDWEERYPENRYAVLWKAKDEENRYSARSLQDAEEYYEYRCLLAGQNRIREAGSLDLRQEDIEYRSGIFRISVARRPSILAAPVPRKPAAFFTFGPFQQTSRRFRPPDFRRAD